LGRETWGVKQHVMSRERGKIEEAVAILGLHKRKVQSMSQRGKLPGAVADGRRGAVTSSAEGSGDGAVCPPVATAA
jgi:hypothetical protein